MSHLPRVLALLLLVPVAAGADTLGDIERTRTFTIAHLTDAPPFAFVGENGEPQGFSIDICHGIADYLKQALGLDTLEVEYLPVTTANRLSAIVDGRADIECGATTSTFSRQERVDFSNLFYVTGASIMTRAGSDATSLGDLAGSKVAVVADTTTEAVMRERLNAGGIDANLVTFDDHEQALRALLAGDVEAMASDQATLLGLGMESGRARDLVLWGVLLSYEPYAFPVPRNDADFRLAVNRALSEIYLSGTIGRLWEQWFGPYGVKPTGLLLQLYRLNSMPE